MAQSTKLQMGVTNEREDRQDRIDKTEKKIIRIFNGCEVLIENSVTRVTVRHHEACQVMPNSYPSDGIFNLHRRTIMDSFSCIFFLRQLHLSLLRLFRTHNSCRCAVWRPKKSPRTSI